MTVERQRHALRLFEQAVALPAVERATLLEAACGGDAELRREVETLLAADEEAGLFGASIEGRLAVRSAHRAA